jgi:hypothetical protein
VRFVLIRWQSIFPRSLFRRQSSISINRLVDEMSWPTLRNGQVIHHIVPFKVSNLHYNWWEVGWLFKVTINPPLENPLLRYGWIYKILFGQNPQKNKKIKIKSYNRFPTCTCLDFITMISNSLGRQGKWVPCKRMYYVL